MSSNTKKYTKRWLEVVLSLAFGAAILWWVYHGFDFRQAKDMLTGGMHYEWMLLSLVPGTTSHLFRGWRWQMLLEPMDVHPRMGNCVNSIFVGYAANLLLPRVGEISRCGILQRYDGVPFSMSLGTIVTDRLVDVVSVGLIIVVALLSQSSAFVSFFQQTGINVGQYLVLLSSWQCLGLVLGMLALIFVVWLLLRRFSVYARVGRMLHNVWLGVASVRHVRRPWLFVLLSAGIWLSFYLEFYVAFFAFGFTASISPMAGFVIFVAGMVAVLVPTPNGAGPWHFAVITMMVLFGVAQPDAAVFALLVHAIQTLWMALLGVYGMVALSVTNRRVYNQ